MEFARKIAITFLVFNTNIGVSLATEKEQEEMEELSHFIPMRTKSIRLGHFDRFRIGEYIFRYLKTPLVVNRNPYIAHDPLDETSAYADLLFNLMWPPEGGI
jgi:hypothetical protein